MRQADLLGANIENRAFGLMNSLLPDNVSMEVLVVHPSGKLEDILEISNGTIAGQPKRCAKSRDPRAGRRRSVGKRWRTGFGVGRRSSVREGRRTNLGQGRRASLWQGRSAELGEGRPNLGKGRRTNLGERRRSSLGVSRRSSLGAGWRTSLRMFGAFFAHYFVLVQREMENWRFAVSQSKQMMDLGIVV